MSCQLLSVIHCLLKEQGFRKVSVFVVNIVQKLYITVTLKLKQLTGRNKFCSYFHAIKYTVGIAKRKRIKIWEQKPALIEVKTLYIFFCKLKTAIPNFSSEFAK